jgi:hypothetical protein
MVEPTSQRFRMKPNCVVGGVWWWNEGGVYRGRDGIGEVGTVRLWAPDGIEWLDVLRGSVVRMDEFATPA